MPLNRKGDDGARVVRPSVEPWGLVDGWTAGKLDNSRCVSASPAVPHFMACNDWGVIQPDSASELREALEAGLVPEGHYVDFKRELNAGRAANREMARDLASFAIDSGQLVIGVEEDRATRRFGPHPIPLAGLAERVSQVALNLVDPPLQVRCHELLHGSDGRGFLVIEVPSSPQAPHQVDGRFWGRNDTTKYPLSHPEVLRTLAGRLERSTQLAQVLDRELERDPIPADERATGHLHVVAAPTLGSPSLLEDALRKQGRGWTAFLEEDIRNGPAGRTHAQSWHPDLSIASSTSRRPNGWALHSDEMGEERRVFPFSGSAPSAPADEDGPPLTPGVERDPPLPSDAEDRMWRMHFRQETNLLELEIDEDGTVHLFTGGITERHRHDHKVVIELAIAGLASRVVRAVATVAKTASYLGPWYVGIGVTGLLGATSLKATQRTVLSSAPYSEDRFMAGAEFTAADIENDKMIVDRLLGRLWRGIGSEFTAAELA